MILTVALSKDVSISLLICLFVLRFYGPVNPVGSFRAHLPDRLSPLTDLPVLCTFFR